MSSMIVSMTQDQLRALVADAIREALSGKLDLTSLVASAPASTAPVKGKRAKKVKDANAPKKPANDWIKFTSRVRAVIAATLPADKKALPKAVTQTAASLKDAGMMATATDEQILAAYANWVANPPAVGKWAASGKTKSKKGSDGSASTTSSAPVSTTGDAVVPKKTRKPMSDEAKAKRAATAAAKKAAKNAETAPAKTEVVSTASATASADGDIMDFEPFTWKKMSLLKNSRGDVLTEDMEWFGTFIDDKMDTSAPQPADLDL